MTTSDIINAVSVIVCAGVLMTPIIIMAILATRARLKEARQIRQNMASGVYAKWDKTQVNRLRTMTLVQMFLLLSFFIWIVTGFLETSKIFSTLRLVVLASIFITMFILGFTINRTIVKGK
ncbi:MAG: hypothetical protein HY865_23845 [Chloroflexi bacterium]|nr:hypothetical protein [Chloroflexota bacterium]